MQAGENPRGGTGRQACAPTSPFPWRPICALLGGMRTHHDQVTIGFGDADPAGIIFYPRLISLAHAAVENLIRHSPLGWDAWFSSHTRAAPVRRVEAEFFSPLPAGEVLRTRTKVEKIGTTSVTFGVEFVHPSGAVAARVVTVHVLIDTTTGRKTALTDEMQRIFGEGPG